MYVFFSTFFDFSGFNIMITYYGWWMPNFLDLYWGRTAILQIDDNILLLLLLLILILCHRRHRHRHSRAALPPIRVLEDCRCCYRCRYRWYMVYKRTTTRRRSSRRRRRRNKGNNNRIINTTTTTIRKRRSQPNTTVTVRHRRAARPGEREEGEIETRGIIIE